MTPPMKKNRLIGPLDAIQNASFFDLTSLSYDVILEFLSYSSPSDLLLLQQTCKLFRDILEDHQICWRRAFRNLDLPPPPILISVPGNWSPAAYSKIIFGGGPCSRCQKWTENFVISFILRIRSCSKKCTSILRQGQTVVVRIHPNDSDDEVFKEIGFDKRSVPYHPRLDALQDVLYRRSDIKLAVEEYNKAVAADLVCIHPAKSSLPCGSGYAMQNLRRRWGQRAINSERLLKAQQNLLDWYDEYAFKKEDISRVNRKFLLEKALEEHIKGTSVTSAPTSLRIAGAYNRDLTRLTDPVWRSIRCEVLDEVRTARKARKDQRD